jgi:hypothetical protein
MSFDQYFASENSDVLISRDEFNERQPAYDDPTFTFVTMSSFGAWARRPAARRGDD